MANNPYDRVVIHTRERPLSSDINQAQSEIDRTTRYWLDQFLLPRAALGDPRAGSPVSGFLGNGFRVEEDSPAGLSVVVPAGTGFKLDAADTVSAIGGIPGVDDLSRYKPLVLLGDATVAVPAPDPTNPRIDIIEVNINRRLADPSNRNVLNPTTGVFDSTSVQKTLAWNVGTSIGTVTTPASSTAALSYKTGIASATPAIPPTSAGYIKIAEILVAGGVTQIDQNNVNDLRNVLGVHNVRRVVARGTFSGGAVTLDALHTSPGVEVAFNDAGGTRQMYIKAGNVVGLVPVALVTADSATAMGATTSIVNTDTALQTSLNTAADTDPVMQVVDDYPSLATSGQKLIKVVLLPSADHTFNVHVEF